MNLIHKLKYQNYKNWNTYMSRIWGPCSISKEMDQFHYKYHNKYKSVLWGFGQVRQQSFKSFIGSKYVD